MWKRNKETFYYPGREIPQRGLDRYRCLDAATKGVLQTARTRTLLIMLGLVLAFGVIIFRLFQLTILNYHARDFKPSVLKTEYGLARKDIVDRNGVVLATSLPTVDLSVNPRKIKNPQEVAEALHKALPDLDYEDVYQKLTSSSGFKYIKRNLTPTERRKVIWIGNQYLEETEGEKRAYPHVNLFSHVLGAVDIDNVGIAGLEKSYEEELRKDHLQLSLDTSIQEIVRQSLIKGLQKYQAIGAVGIVMNAQNGEILALVSLPDYDPNFPGKGPLENRFNKVTLGTYEFGSVFKLFNTAMALENKVIQPMDTFDVSEPLKVGRKLITDFRGEERVLTVPEILMHSSNIGSAKIALKAGWEKQKNFLKKFGFYEKLPIQFPERGNPLYPNGKKWSDISTATIAYGYGIAVTPLHVIAAVSSLVNGGYYHVPTFIKGGNEGKVEYKVLSSQTSEKIRHMMWAVVNWKLDEKDDIWPYIVGGKTGTANLIGKGEGYTSGHSRTSFLAAFPMNKPQYVVMVTFRNPKRAPGEYYNNAGWNAKPIGLEIVSQVASYLGVPPQSNWDQPEYITKSIEISNRYRNKDRQRKKR